MSHSGQELTARLYSLVHSLERFGPMPGWSNVPADGVYFFFERGETVPLDGRSVERIVCVGTHRADGGLKRRLRDHFSGSRRTSAFRRHLGLALLALDGAGSARTVAWLTGASGEVVDLEARVDDLLRERFTFRAIPIRTMTERLAVEQGLIALLARSPLGTPSQTWLGHHAVSAAVRGSGLWNVNHINGGAIDEERLARIVALSQPLGEARSVPSS
ncbi:MAG: hypothetical protein M3354_04070 [Chloroflexota bacterium]|nr:hypothetical protein [Chloroflexota bacterium]